MRSLFQKTSTKVSICSPFYLIALYENQARPLTSTFFILSSLSIIETFPGYHQEKNQTSKPCLTSVSSLCTRNNRDLWSQIVLRFAICNQKSFITPQTYIRNNTFQLHRRLWVLANLIKIEISYQTVWDITRLLFSRSKIWLELVSICSVFNLIAWDEKRLRSH